VKSTGLIGVVTRLRGSQRWLAARMNRVRAAADRFALPPLSGPAARGALTALLLWLSVAYAVHVLRVFGGPTIDDAAITYSYADNLGHGRGLRLTPG
jgi:hypothetical protein